MDWGPVETARLKKKYILRMAYHFFVMNLDLQFPGSDDKVDADLHVCCIQRCATANLRFTFVN